MVDVSQLLVAEDADDDGEEDAGYFPKSNHELKQAIPPSTGGGGESLKDDKIIDVYDDNFLKVG